MEIKIYSVLAPQWMNIKSLLKKLMNPGETYLVTENGNERLGKKKLDLVIL